MLRETGKMGTDHSVHAHSTSRLERRRRGQSSLSPFFPFLAFLLATTLSAATLIDAAKSSDKETVKSLVAKKSDVNQAAPDGTTPLLWSAYRDDLDSADLLLKAGAKPNLANDLGAT